jgi:DNA-binding transcriptional regulator LsrR (DeoR family)
MGAPVAGWINQLPFKCWLHTEELSQRLGLAPEEVEKVLRAGRRRGSITVDRNGGKPRFMRIARHPLPSARLRPSS